MKKLFLVLLFLSAVWGVRPALTAPGDHCWCKDAQGVCLNHDGFRQETECEAYCALVPGRIKIIYNNSLNLPASIFGCVETSVRAGVCGSAIPGEIRQDAVCKESLIQRDCSLVPGCGWSECKPVIADPGADIFCTQKITNALLLTKKVCEDGVVFKTNNFDNRCIYFFTASGAAEVKKPVTDSKSAEDSLNTLKAGTKSALSRVSFGSLAEVIGQIIFFLTGIMGTFALVMYVYAGGLWMTAAGNAENMDKSKNIIIWTTMGVGVTLAATALVQFLFDNILAK